MLGIGDLPQNQEGFLTLSNGGDKERGEATKKRESEEQKCERECLEWHHAICLCLGPTCGRLLPPINHLSLSHTNTALHGMQIRLSFS